MTRCVVLLSLGLVALAGCSGGGGTVPNVSCSNGVATDAQAHLVTPASGATGVSPAIGSITVAYGIATVVQPGVTLTPSDGSASVTGNPSFTGVLPQSGTVQVTIPALKPSTTYAVTGRSVNMAHVPCFTTVTASFGSFTTQ